MQNLFSPEGPAFRFITKLVGSVWLNILWFVCCLPIFTIGASTTALFYCCEKMSLDEDGYLTRSFFHSFRENFRQSTCAGLIMTALGILLAADGYILYHLHSGSVFWTLITAIYLVALIAYAIEAMYLYPLMARFENDTIHMFKNAMMIGMRFLFCTILMALVYFLMLLIVVRFFTPAIIFGMGTCAFLNSMLLKNILLQCERNSASPEQA